MKRTPILITLLFFTICSFSQTLERQLISTSGTSSEGSTITLDWVMGESFHAINETESLVMKEGFLQPDIYTYNDESQLSIHLDNQENKDFEAFIYPNPFDAQFTFQLLEPREKDLQLSLLDYTGKLIMSKNLIAGSDQMDWNMDHYTAGLYFLHVTTGDDTGYQIFKVLKHY